MVLLPISRARAYYEISSDSKVLSWCEGVYIYYAHVNQIRNNEGAAKNLLFRASRVVTANMFMNLDGQTVSGDKLAQFKAVRRGMKERFDKDPNFYSGEVDSCDKKVAPIISNIQGDKKRWRGVSFLEFQQKMLESYLRSFGIG